MTQPDDEPLTTEDPLTEEERIEMEKEIEIAMAPYVGLASVLLLAQMRANLEENLRSHPVARSLLRRFAPRPAVAISGEVRRDGRPDLGAGSRKEGA
jgi:hypothetical protein